MVYVIVWNGEVLKVFVEEVVIGIKGGVVKVCKFD